MCFFLLFFFFLFISLKDCSAIWTSARKSWDTIGRRQWHTGMNSNSLVKSHKFILFILLAILLFRVTQQRLYDCVELDWWPFRYLIKYNLNVFLCEKKSFKYFFCSSDSIFKWNWLVYIFFFHFQIDTA